MSGETKNFVEENKELLIKVYNTLKLVYPNDNITLAQLMAGAEGYIENGANTEDKPPEEKPPEEKPKKTKKKKTKSKKKELTEEEKQKRSAFYSRILQLYSTMYVTMLMKEYDEHGEESAKKLEETILEKIEISSPTSAKRRRMKPALKKLLETRKKARRTRKKSKT